jgi:hypothetical protein
MHPVSKMHAVFKRVVSSCSIYKYHSLIGDSTDTLGGSSSGIYDRLLSI